MSLAFTFFPRKSRPLGSHRVGGIWKAGKVTKKSFRNRNARINLHHVCRKFRHRAWVVSRRNLTPSIDSSPPHPANDFDSFAQNNLVLRLFQLSKQKPLRSWQRGFFLVHPLTGFVGLTKSLDFRNLRSLESFRTFLDFKFDGIAFVQGLVAVTHDGVEVYEDILAARS